MDTTYVFLKYSVVVQDFHIIHSRLLRAWVTIEHIQADNCPKGSAYRNRDAIRVGKTMEWGMHV